MLVPGLDPFHHLASFQVKLTKYLPSAVLPTLCFTPTSPLSHTSLRQARHLLPESLISSPATTTSSLWLSINAQASEPLHHRFGRPTER